MPQVTETKPKKRTKVLYVITKSNWGGAQRYVYDLATGLDSEHFEVVVAFGGTGISGSTPGQLAVKLREAGLRTIMIPELGRDISPLADFSSFFALAQLFRKEHPHVIHLNSSKASGLGTVVGRLVGIPRIIFTAHGWPFRENRNPLMRTALWFASWLTSMLAHSVICVSLYDLQQAKRMPFIGNKAVCIHNGINLQIRFALGEEIRKAFPPEVKIVGTIGELTRNKNHISLIEQAKNDPRMYVAIVGEGELRPILEQRIREHELEERVKLFGFMPATEVLKGFDHFVLPSLKEGFPYVLLEARLAGLPITANRVGGVGEILDAKDLSEFTLEQMLQQTYALYR